MTRTRDYGARTASFKYANLLIALLLIFNYGLTQKCPNVGEYDGLTPVDPKRSSIKVKNHVEKLFNTDNPVNISSYFRITDIPAKAKQIELINAVVMQYGKTGDKTLDASWQKVYNDSDKLESGIGYSRPVKFRVYYDVATKDIKAVAHIYNPLFLKKSKIRNNKFKEEKNKKIVELPRQVLFGSWVFGGKKKGGHNMTNKWFFIGLKLHTAIAALKYTNGYKQKDSYWTAFTQPDTDTLGHSLDNMYVWRLKNQYFKKDNNFGPRGALCECSDGTRYYIGEQAASRKLKDLKTVKWGCVNGKILKKFGNKKDCKECNKKRVICDSKPAWTNMRLSTHPGNTSRELPDKFWFKGRPRNLRYYYTIAANSYSSWKLWHTDKTKDDKGKHKKYKGSFLGHTWGANGSPYMIERFNHSNMLIHFRPNAITPNDKHGNIFQTNWFTNANVNIQRISQNPIYDTSDVPDLHPKGRVNGFFIDANKNPSDVTAASRTIYGEVLYKIPSFFSKTENFRYSEFNKMLSEKYGPKKQVWLNNSNFSKEIDLRRWVRVYRLQLNKDTPLVELGLHFDMDNYYNKRMRRRLFEER